MRPINLLLLLCFMLPLQNIVQGSSAFSDLNARWFVKDQYLNNTMEQPEFVEKITEVYGFKNDTVIDGQQWFSLYNSRDSAFVEGLEHTGFIKDQDSVVIFRENWGGEDKILYDFTLDEGDSVDFYFETYGDLTLHVEEVDSISIHGEPKRRLQFEKKFFSMNDYFTDVWIQGVGSIYGLMHPIEPQEHSTPGAPPQAIDLTCVYINDSIFWRNPEFNHCYYSVILNLDKPENQNAFKVYPNPFRQTLHISGSPLVNMQYELRDTYGRVLYDGKLASNETELKFPDLPQGHYILTLQNGEEIWKKILVRE